MDSSSSRRPLKSRSSAWANWCARCLARAGATPNGISATSLLFAALGGLAFAAVGKGWVFPWLGWFAGAACVQLRLACNLLDGMVAIERGKKTPTGGVWNEVPDRFADTILLVCAGIGCGAPVAGVCAAWAAAMTAYVRSLGAEISGEQDFCGPFAKPHRMAALTVMSLLMVLADFWSGLARVMPWALWIIAIGTIFTIFRRLLRLSKRLKISTKP